jgi:hypothetical protein
MPSKADRIKVPRFATESEEAKWWDDRQSMVEENMIRAMRDGTVQQGTAQRLAGAARASRNVTIRMSEADLNLARRSGGSQGSALSEEAAGELDR